jgi:hypothetical protein
MAGLNDPTLPMAPLPAPSTTAMVGSARCCTPRVFSVVNSSSKPTGSMLPAPTLTA